MAKQRKAMADDKSEGGGGWLPGSGTLLCVLLPASRSLSPAACAMWSGAVQGHVGPDRKGRMRQLTLGSAG